MDAVMSRAKRMERSLGNRDREKLDQYFTAVRETEQRLTKAEAWSQRPKPTVEAKPPRDINDRSDIIGRVRLMYDMIYLALKTDSSRLITFSNGDTNSVPPIEGVTFDYHNLSHHGKDPDKIAQLRIVEMEQMLAFRDLLARLAQTEDLGGNLLDQTMILFGSNLGNARSHDTRNLPIILAGGGLKHGQHLAFDRDKNSPLPNLFVTMLQRPGIETDEFASSTGSLTGLT